jgi:hypothetical protein
MESQIQLICIIAFQALGRSDEAIEGVTTNPQGAD